MHDCRAVGRGTIAAPRAPRCERSLPRSANRKLEVKKNDMKLTSVLASQYLAELVCLFFFSVLRAEFFPRSSWSPARRPAQHLLIARHIAPQGPSRRSEETDQACQRSTCVCASRLPQARTRSSKRRSTCPLCSKSDCSRFRPPPVPP